MTYMEPKPLKRGYIPYIDMAQDDYGTQMDVGLLTSHRMHKYLVISLTPGSEKADLNQSQTMQILLQAKEN